MQRIAPTILVMFLLLAAGAGAARAHAFLSHASPAVGSTVQGSPSLLELWFSEGVEPAFSKVSVLDGAGQPVAAGPLKADPADKAHLTLSLPTLAPGSYSVSWQAVSVDTHRTTGTFKFTVAP
jgi:methionine-rich copper-binding protein CopC